MTHSSFIETRGSPPLAKAIFGWRTISFAIALSVGTCSAIAQTSTLLRPPLTPPASAEPTRSPLTAPQPAVEGLRVDSPSALSAPSARAIGGLTAPANAQPASTTAKSALTAPLDRAHAGSVFGAAPPTASGKAVTTTLFTMTGMGNAATGSYSGGAFKPIALTTKAFAMTGQGYAMVAPTSTTFSPKKVTTTTFTMTGIRK